MKSPALWPGDGRPRIWFQRLQAMEPRITDTLTLLGKNEQVSSYLDVTRAGQTWQTLCQQPFGYRHQQRCMMEIMPALATACSCLKRKTSQPISGSWAVPPEPSPLRHTSVFIPDDFPK